MSKPFLSLGLAAGQLDQFAALLSHSRGDFPAVERFQIGERRRAQCALRYCRAYPERYVPAVTMYTLNLRRAGRLS